MSRERPTTALQRHSTILIDATVEFSLVEALRLETFAAYGARKTGEKFFVTPQA